jgi:E3 ubiquitin-protein ligase synoviolin
MDVDGDPALGERPEGLPEQARPAADVVDQPQDGRERIQGISTGPVKNYSFVQKYATASIALSAILLYYAMAVHGQFYPAMEYLETSKVSLAVLGNVGFALSLLSYKAIVFAFLGHLRDYEVERVHDRVGQAIIESLLAMTIFRQNMETFGFISRFVLLAFIKMFHWLAQDRVDFIETMPDVSLLQHIRLFSMTGWLAVVDVCLLQVSLANTFASGISAHLLFAFEYLMQTTLALSIMLKYLFSLLDMRLWNGSWRGKSVAIFYVDLTRDLVHLITYLGFFLVVFSTYGIPIHLIRDIYWTFRNFQARVRAFLRFRQISSNMENRFPTATEEDLERSDHMCIVCREDMNADMMPKKLPCGHCFHTDCLKSWLERQQNCPICRSAIPAEQEEEVDDTNREINQQRGEPREEDAGAAVDAEPDVAEHQFVQNEVVVEEEADQTPDHSLLQDQQQLRENFLRRLERHQGEHAEEPQEGEGPSTSRKQEEDAQPCHEETQAEASLEPPPTISTEEASTSRGIPPEDVYNRPPPVLFFPTPGTMMFQMPTFQVDQDIGNTLREEAARNHGLNPTDEQHERAFAVAQAAAHAAAIAAATTAV